MSFITRTSLQSWRRDVRTISLFFFFLHGYIFAHNILDNCHRYLRINIHLMYGPEGNSLFCFPESPDVSLDFVSGNIRTLGKTKLTSFPRDQTLSALLYI